MNEIKNLKNITLKNGLKIYYLNNNNKTTNIRLLVSHGTINENQEEYGIAHFLEHSIIKAGSKKYTPIEVSNLRSNFSYTNALTNLLETKYIAELLKEDVESYLYLLSSIIFEPIFDKKTIEIERKRIIKETIDAQNNNIRKEILEFINLFLEKDSPYNKDPLGTINNVKSITIEQIKKFYKRGYYAKNMNLILVGNLPKNIIEIINNTFGRFNNEIKKDSQKELPEIIKNKKKNYYRIPDKSLKYSDNLNENNSIVSINFNIPKKSNQDYFATSLLNEILLSNPTSSILPKIISKKGLAYHFKSTFRPEINVLRIRGMFNTLKTDETLNLIFNEINKIQENPINESLINNAKRKKKFQILRNSNINNYFMDSIISKIKYGYTNEEFLEKIEKVTAKEIQEVAIKYFPRNKNDKKCTIIIKDPIKN